jgi:hypothetical protein
MWDALRIDRPVPSSSKIAADSLMSWWLHPGIAVVQICLPKSSSALLTGITF